MTHVRVPSLEFSHRVKQWHLRDSLRGVLSYAITLQYGKRGHELISQIQRLVLDAASCQGRKGELGEHAFKVLVQGMQALERQPRSALSYHRRLVLGKTEEPEETEDGW